MATSDIHIDLIKCVPSCHQPWTSLQQILVSQLLYLFAYLEHERIDCITIVF